MLEYCRTSMKGGTMARRLRFLLGVLLISSICAARAEQLALPAQLTVIGAEAFAGNEEISEVVIPEGIVSIGDCAFSECSRLGWITIPQSAEELGEGFVSGCADDLLIRTSAQSAACRYAQENQIDYQAGTVYRALLIGQTYPNIPALKLNGPQNDVDAMARCLERFDDTRYQTTVCMNLTAGEMLSAIHETFADAADEDVSLIYYSGHGAASDDFSQRGALLGADNEGAVSAEQLRSALDGVAGRKIVIIDACYSGSMLSDVQCASLSLNDDAMTAEAFVDSFIAAFLRRGRSGLAGGGYFVLAAAAEDEESFEGQVGDRIMGLFTASLIKGCGYDALNRCETALLADANANGVLTLQEIFQYVRRALIGEGQHAQVFPAGCRWFGLFRE